MTGRALPTAEHVIRNGAALVSDASELIWVVGADSVVFLDGLLSQAVEATPVGTVRRALLLSPRGKLVSPLWLLRGHGAVGLVADSGCGGAVLETLQRFRLRVDVEVQRASGPASEVWGGEAVDAVRGATGLACPASGWARRADTVIANLPFRHTDLSRWLVCGVEPAALAAAGATPVPDEVVAAVRIEVGEPRMGVDLDESTIPQEAELVVGAVDFDKGCYLGQELVARIESRGHVNRRLRGLRCVGDRVPPPGAVLSSGEGEVGILTSVARSARLGGTIGLGLIRSEVVPGADLTVRWDDDATSARVIELPF